MSEEEEDYDELPPISVNSSTRESLFSMPCASELATQRAHEEQCELEIRRLREDHSQEGECAVGRVVHSDSSGSEGEVALAAAVTALQVRSTRPSSPTAAALLAALAPSLPPAPFLRDYLAAASAAPPPALRALNADITVRIGGAAAAAAAGSRWEDGEAVAAGAWLCSALAALAARRRPALARAAHVVLDDAAGERAVAALRAALAAAPAPWGAPQRLELADALRGGGARCEAMADELTAAALEALLGAGGAAAWRRLEANEQCVALRLAGRMRAHGAPGASAGPLEALAAAAPSARDRRPDALEVLVAASKLQVLFNVKK